MFGRRYFGNRYFGFRYFGPEGDDKATGAVDVIEADDTLTASGALRILGSLAAQEEDDALTASAALIIIAEGAATEGDDTLDASGRLRITATAALAEDDDVLFASTVQPITGAADLTEEDDTLTAAGEIVLPHFEERRFLRARYEAPVMAVARHDTPPLHKARREPRTFSLTALAYNIKRAITIVGVPGLIATVRA